MSIRHLPFLVHTVIYAAVVADVWATIPDSLKHRIDSLQEVARISTGLGKYAASFQIAYDLFDVDNHVAVIYAGLAHEIACEERDTIKFVRSGRLYGQLLRRIDKLDEAIGFFSTLVPLAERMDNRVEFGKILNALAVAYTYQGRFDEALSTNFRTLKLRRLMRDTIRIASSHLNIGLVYYQMGYFIEANKYFRKAIDGPDSVVTSFSLLNMGLTNIYLDDLVSFPDLAQRGLQIAPAGIYLSALAEYEYGFGFYYLKKGNIDSAETYFKRAEQHSEEIADVRCAMESRINIAVCAAKRGDVGTAISILKDVEKGLLKFGYKNVRQRCYEHLSTLLERKGRWKESSIYKSRLLSLKDTLQRQQIQSNMMTARLEFEEHENEMMIASQAQIISLKEEVIQRQAWLIAAAVSTGILLIGFVVLLYRLASYQRKISRDLDRKVSERTKELLERENELILTVREQYMLMDMISGRVRASIATFRGLWNVKAAESKDESSRDAQFEATAKELLRLSQIIDRGNDMRVHRYLDHKAAG